LHDGFPNIEHDLLRRIAEGDEMAFRQLFNAYRKQIFSYVLKITDSREMAEDALQEIFLTIWSRRDKLSGITNVNAYLHRMAHNHAYHAFRRIAREMLVLDQLKHPDLDPWDPNTALISKEVKMQIQNLVERLTPRQREVFLLSREDGLKHEEIASRLGLTRETVKKHMVDALRFLREELGQSYGSLAVAIFVLYHPELS
jgi:RNA polymerase sigma-70 factor (ECF subfamily)